MSPDDVRALLADCFSVAVKAADPASAVRQALKRHQERVAKARRVLIVALGKAACAMAEAAANELGEKATAGIVVTTQESARPVADFQVIAGGHPVPDAGSLSGGEAILSLARTAAETDLVLALISGGGSALAVAPKPGLTLALKQQITEALLRSGADITEINAVRRRLSLLKGGGLLRAAAPASVLALIVSDVPGDDPTIIASGPTAPMRPGQPVEAVLRAANLDHGLPATVTELLLAAPDSFGLCHVHNEIIASNAASVSAVGRFLASKGIVAVCYQHWLDGDVQAAAEAILRMMKLTTDQQGLTAIICGGETTVRVTGGGTGGRNQELALRLAQTEAASPLGRPWTFLSAGTDGRDGPTQAAGGFADSDTMNRLMHHGLKLKEILANNDSYTALRATGDAFITGPTGTNVADIQIALVG
ncbi:glycerate kinase type-2 family protein [Gemmobacter caeni]|uniref:Hydroxypyruvate reductase n=2 Tax=Gemmobacter caeni TaxID=589035 RepID=A0A2T6AG44_9RHOB|nr:DUF4147 domain-containing protein [Gemmobacter caeni]PTX42781.1 hydroxypyruvate reductase [Gemmobacter caeni]